MDACASLLHVHTEKSPLTILTNYQSLHNGAINVMERLGKLAGLAKDAVFGALHFVRLGRRSRATMTVNALNILATTPILAGCHARD